MLSPSARTLRITFARTENWPSAMSNIVGSFRVAGEDCCLADGYSQPQGGLHVLPLANEDSVVVSLHQPHEPHVPGHLCGRPVSQHQHGIGHARQAQ